ncbi:MAG: hypothetical protein ACRC9E_06215 [Plesiomonas shigelloides]
MRFSLGSAGAKVSAAGCLSMLCAKSPYLCIGLRSWNDIIELQRELKHHAENAGPPRWGPGWYSPDEIDRRLAERRIAQLTDESKLQVKTAEPLRSCLGWRFREEINTLKAERFVARKALQCARKSRKAVGNPKEQLQTCDLPCSTTLKDRFAQIRTQFSRLKNGSTKKRCAKLYGIAFLLASGVR